MGTKLYSSNTFQQQAKEIAFEALFDAFPINFSWMDTAGYILGCNEQVLKAQNIETYLDIVGKHTTQICSDEVWENTKKVIKSGKTLMFDEEHQKEDGTTIYFLSVKSPIISCHQKIVGVVNIAVDVTDRKSLELQLKRNHEELTIANKVKTEFLANMRHDLRTPLTGICNIVEFLYKKESEEDKKGLLDDIRQCTESMLGQLNNILDHVKIESGELEIIEKEFNLGELLTSIYKVLKIEADRRNLKFTISSHIELPPKLIGDPVRTERILMNLLSNAIKFTHKGFIRITLDWIPMDDEKGIAQFTIEDSGIGIPEDKIEHIFERFTRLTDSSEGIYPGTGLGLNIVKRFLSDMGGRYDVMSQIGKGSKFNICIPYKIPLHKIDIHKSSKKEPRAMNKILLVEDHPVISKMCKMMLEDLEELNCKVDVAKSGQTALELINDNHYDLVLLDIGLPDIDGHTVAKCIREHDDPKVANVPIIAVTAHTEDKESEKCFDVGMQDVIIKPLTYEKAKTFVKYLS